jgi:transposase
MIGSSVRVFLAVGAVDLRGAFDRLSCVTREVLQQDPKSGALYIFVNRRRNRVKALWWDRNGYTILYKRLSRGTFQLPQTRSNDSACLEISPTDFSRLIAGLAISDYRTDSAA